MSEHFVPPGLQPAPPAEVSPFGDYTAASSGDAVLALVYEVEARIEEVSADGATPDVPHALIRTHLADAAVAVARRAPRGDVLALARDYAVGVGAGAYPVGQGLRVPLPAGLVRFLRVRLAGWRVPVDELKEPSSGLYRLAQNPLVAPSPDRPMAVLVASPGTPAVGAASTAVTGAIECFPAPTRATAGDAVVELVCVASPAPEAVAAAGPALRDALLWEAAGRVYTGLREPALAAPCYEAAARALGEPAPGRAAPIDRAAAGDA
ncbi:MAG TPA: hypothetical protein VK610_04625 [Rhodothermales bacterium]|nr:hypothetical protein [Rhodothermales bacterium]